MKCARRQSTGWLGWKNEGGKECAQRMYVYPSDGRRVAGQRKLVMINKSEMINN